MTEDEIRERLIRLESRYEVMETFMRDSVADRKLLHQTLDSIGKKLDRQHSFMGGVVFVVSALWAFFLVIKDWLIGLAHK